MRDKIFTSKIAAVIRINTAVQNFNRQILCCKIDRTEGAGLQGPRTHDFLINLSRVLITSGDDEEELRELSEER